MKKAFVIGVLFCAALTPACMTDGKTDDDVELGTAEQSLTTTGVLVGNVQNLPLFLKPFGDSARKKLCDAMSNKSFTSTVGTCTSTHTTGTCVFNETTFDCTCPETITQGSGC